MKGTFKVIDGKPFVETNKTKKKFELVNVNQCKTYNITPETYQTMSIWSVVPFTDSEFWSEDKPVPFLYLGQQIQVKNIEEQKAKIVKLS